MQPIIDLLTQMLALLQQIVFPPKGNAQAIPPGAVLTYYADIASGAIRPEDVRFEALTFKLIVDGTGTPVFTSDKVTVIARYSLAIRRMYAAVFNPEFAGPAAGFINFNVLEQARNFSIFKRPVCLAAVTTGGSTEPFAWDGVYITVPGTDLEVSWSIDSALYASLVGTTKQACVVISGDYIACGPQG